MMIGCIGTDGEFRKKIMSKWIWESVNSTKYEDVFFSRTITFSDERWISVKSMRMTSVASLPKLFGIWIDAIYLYKI